MRFGVPFCSSLTAVFFSCVAVACFGLTVVFHPLTPIYFFASGLVVGFAQSLRLHSGHALGSFPGWR